MTTAVTGQVFRLPDLGEGLTEAEIIDWKVAVGDVVEVDQIVLEVETAKAAVELPVPYAGTVLRLHAAAGTVLSVGEPLIEVGTADAADPAASRYREEEQAGSGNVLIGYGTGHGAGTRRRRRRARPAAQAAETPAGTPTETPTETPAGTPTKTSAGPSARPSAGTSAETAARTSAVVAAARAPEPVAATAPQRADAVRHAPRVISPLVRKLAREHGLDLTAVTPTGPRGVILRRDVEQAIATTAGKTPETPSPEGERIPLRGLRRAVADKLTRSRTEIPDATTWVDVDATALLATKDELKRARPDLGIGLLAILARICVSGLRRFPELNSSVDVERAEIVRHGHVNLGFAAQTDRGLVVPVVRDAHQMTTAELAAELTRLTGLARAGRLPPAALTGGTFTLNNYGVFGVDGSTPIINHPEAALLGVGRIIDRPWVVGGAVVPRKITQLSFTFDHRVCDGGAAGGFLRYVADCVERPSVLLAHT
jgi:pyruvate dehydrogenase E2 component (dihydrolipoamide acetyltransferase)